MLPEFAQNWYSFEDIQQALPMLSERTLRRRLAGIPESSTRDDAPAGSGRPRKLYHQLAIPELAALHKLKLLNGGLSPSLSPNSVHSVHSVKTPSLSPSSLAVAELRAQAVQEFIMRRKSFPSARAAKLTCQDWARVQRERKIESTRRLPGGYTPEIEKIVRLGEFAPRTLMSWYSIYKGAHEDLLALAPKNNQSGRKKKDIPDHFIEYVYAILGGSTVRADVKKAVTVIAQEFPGECPKVSLSTWRRRILQKDPRKGFKDIRVGVGQFRLNQSPDIEVDWQKLDYNGRWEIDDVEKDWYGYSSDQQRLTRPKAYAIIRARTRQWIALCTSENPITQDQSRSLIGHAMASKQGGIPTEIKFEHGTVAGDPYLFWLLGTLGIKVSHISMNAGKAFDQAFPDRGRGNPHGHPLVESNFRGLHNHEALIPTQVGGNERDTAPSHTEALQKIAQDNMANGQKLTFIPSASEWHALCLATCEKHNNSPHSGLPMIIDPATGEQRHCTPNELAAHLGDQEIKTMDANYLPLFSQKGVEVPVTKNGIRIGNQSFGRFDDDLKKLRRVTVYHDPFNSTAFVAELGRILEAYKKAEPGDYSQIALKKHDENQFRNQHQAAVSAAISAGVSVIVDATQITANPFPERPSTVASAPELDTRARAFAGARSAHAEEEIAFNARFRPAGTAPAARRRSGRGLLARSEELGAEMSAIGGNKMEVTT